MVQLLPPDPSGPTFGRCRLGPVRQLPCTYPPQSTRCSFLYPRAFLFSSESIPFLPPFGLSGIPRELTRPTILPIPLKPFDGARLVCTTPTPGSPPMKSFCSTAPASPCGGRFRYIRKSLVPPDLSRPLPHPSTEEGPLVSPFCKGALTARIAVHSPPPNFFFCPRIEIEHFP